MIGLSHAEIAERLGCSEGNARQKLFRALSALAEAMEGITHFAAANLPALKVLTREIMDGGPHVAVVLEYEHFHIGHRTEVAATGRPPTAGRPLARSSARMQRCAAKPSGRDDDAPRWPWSPSR